MEKGVMGLRGGATGFTSAMTFACKRASISFP
jgi:hypothetical protein